MPLQHQQHQDHHCHDHHHHRRRRRHRPDDESTAFAAATRTWMCPILMRLTEDQVRVAKDRKVKDRQGLVAYSGKRLYTVRWHIYLDVPVCI